MAIIFKEDRELPGGGSVQAGQAYSYSPEEEKAFVDNGVAEFAPEKKKQAPAGQGGEVNNG